MGRVTLATDQYVEGAATPIFATRTQYDEFGRAFRSMRLTGVEVDLVSGNTVIADLGTVQWSTETVYNSKGQIARSVAADGQITEYEYDNLGRQIAVIGHPVTIDGVVVRHRSETVYNAIGQVEIQRVNVRQLANGTIDPTNAHETHYQYDEAGNVTKTTFPDSTFISATYDELGRKTSETNQLGLTRDFEYDDAGRLIAVELPAIADPANGGQLTRPRYEYAYDALGNQTLIRDPLGRETRFTYDSEGRQLSRTLPLGLGADGIAGTSDDTTLPEGDFTETFEYDDLGRQTLHVSFEGVVTESEYDSQTGRLIAKRFFDNLTQYDGGLGLPSETWTYLHDAFGRVIEATQTIGVTDRSTFTTYDSEGRATRIESPEGAINYEYDVFGRLVRTTVGDSVNPTEDTRYTYDALGRLADVKVYERNDTPLAQVETTAYQYDLAGNLDLQAQANGVIVDYVYDDMNRLEDLIHFAPDSTPETLADNDIIASFQYTYRNDGRRTAASESFWIDGLEKQNQITWTYDDASRLTDEVFESYDNALDQTESFVYDLVGNRLQQTVDKGNNSSIDETTDYAYDVNDRLLSEQADTNGDSVTDKVTTYGYDNTQQTSKEVSVSGVLTQRTTMDYDLQGRLSEFTVETLDANGDPTRIETTRYGYNTAGIRAWAEHEIDANGDGTAETRRRTEYLNDPLNHTGYSQVLKETEFTWNETTSQWETTKETVYTLGHDLVSQATVEYTAGVPSAPVVMAFGYDGHGSTRVLLDVAGAIATIASTPQIFHFEAYGKALGFDPAVAATTYLYSGEQFDPRIGQQYLRARYYDPLTGRFNRLDPFFGNLEDPQSLHKYLYTHADPINGIDPSGELPIFIALALLAIFQLLLVPNFANGPGLDEVTKEDAGDQHIPSAIVQLVLGLGLIGVARFASFVSPYLAAAIGAAVIQLNKIGGLREAAVFVHNLAASATSRIGVNQTTVAIVEAIVPNGTKEGVRRFFASGSGAYLRPVQVEALKKLGVLREHIFTGAKYSKGFLAAENHAELVILRNLPEGAKVVRWGISWGGRQRAVPCPKCEPFVRQAGGLLEL